MTTTVQTVANGQALCHKCALALQLKISKECRTHVGQWIKFDSVNVRNSHKIQCTVCHNHC